MNHSRFSVSRRDYARPTRNRRAMHERLFCAPDLALTLPVSKSVRLNGKSTCIRLELAYWRMLEKIAACQGVTVNAVLAELDLEVQQRGETVKNFSSLVRVTAVVTLLRRSGVTL